jgi:hypothetical protein
MEARIIFGVFVVVMLYGAANGRLNKMVTL